MFKEYLAKPIIRMARVINADDKITYDKAEHSAVIVRQADSQEFHVKAHQQPVPGDYIVFRGDSQPIFQPKAQFEEQNIIE